MYNICKQNAENIRETRNFVLKRHRNKKLCKNVIVSKHIKSNKNKKSHIYIQKFYSIFTLYRAFQIVHKSKKIC